MASVKLFQLYDTNAESVSGPLLAAANQAPYIREFKRLLGDPNSDPGRYPEDFELRELGTQDTATGAITALETPRTLYSGKQWLLDQNNGLTSSAPSMRQNGPTNS